MDREVWWDTVHVVTKSRTWLSMHTHTHTHTHTKEEDLESSCPSSHYLLLEGQIYLINAIAGTLSFIPFFHFSIFSKSSSLMHWPIPYFFLLFTCTYMPSITLCFYLCFFSSSKPKSISLHSQMICCLLENGVTIQLPTKQILWSHWKLCRFIYFDMER